MNTFNRSAKTKLKRLPKRGSYDAETVYSIIDEALLCHVSFTLDAVPCVIPTSIIRIDNSVYIHGSRVSRMLKHLAAGAPACIAVTLLDGLVLARSGFHHSVNYRSVIIYAHGEAVEGPGKSEILDAFVEDLIPGRLKDIRPATRKEVNATTVIRFELDEVSAKIRTGPPVDDAEDYDLPVWAGVLPLGMSKTKPVADPDMKMELPIPAYVSRYKR